MKRHGRDIPYAESERLRDEPITITPQELANRLHRLNGHGDQDHGPFDSCACMHLAFWYLGVVDDPGLFWPDDQGGNAWSSEPPAS